VAVFSAQVPVTTTATALTNATNTVGPGTGAIMFCNRGTAAVYVGGPAVTTGTGFQLDVGQAIPADASVGWFAIAASGTHRVDVLTAGS
jgi:hypothetical protein